MKKAFIDSLYVFTSFPFFVVGLGGVILMGGMVDIKEAFGIYFVSFAIISFSMFLASFYDEGDERESLEERNEIS